MKKKPSVKIIAVDAKLYKAWREAREAAAVASALADTARQLVGIPTATELVKKYGITKTESPEFIIIDKSEKPSGAEPLGKIVVYHAPGYTVEGGFRARVT